MAKRYAELFRALVMLRVCNILQQFREQRPFHGLSRHLAVVAAQQTVVAVSSVLPLTALIGREGVVFLSFCRIPNNILEKFLP